MNPSYTNGVGAQAPQNSPQRSASQGPGVSQQSVGSQFGQFGQPGQSGQSAVSSGTGDIVLSGGASEKKSRKGVIILIVLVVLLALVGGGYLLWQNGVFGGSNTKQLVGVQEAYNSYVNYVLYGEDSDERYRNESIESWMPYFRVLDDEELKTYLDVANDKYTGFVDVYFGKEDVGILRTYFQEYAAIQPMTFQEILNVYVENGREGVRKMVDEKYVILDNNEQLQAYIVAMKDWVDTYTNYLSKIEENGCIKDGIIMNNCYTISDEEAKTLNEKSNKVQDLVENLNTEAMSRIDQIYVELYGGSIKDGEVNNE